MFTPLTDPSPLPRAYTDATPPGPPASTLGGTSRVDVAIVGGGLTGVSAALHLAEAGLLPAVLEAKEIGSGGSGRAFGQVVPYAKHDHDDILARFGKARGERLIDALASGPDVVFGLTRRHAIACDPVRTGLIFAAHTARSEPVLQRRAAYWQARGAPVDYLGAAATASAVGSAYYPASLIDHRGGTVNPLAYVRGLARAASDAGALFYMPARALAIEREGAGWRVRTAEASLLAGSVIIGSGAYTDGLWPGLASTIIPMRAHVLVSAPLSANVRATVLPGGRALTDTRRLYSGMRVRQDGRLQMSTDGPAFTPRGKPALAVADRRVRDVFPQLGRVQWEEAWTGWVDMSTDSYPHLHQLAPGVWAAIGLSGRGIALATLIGRELAWRIAGRQEEMLLPVTEARAIAVRRVAAPLVGGLLAAYRMMDRRELAGYVRRRPDATPIGPA